MAKEKSVASGGLMGEVFSSAIYKPTQGGRTRVLTAVAIVVVGAIAAYQLSFQSFVNGWFAYSNILISGLFALLVAWLAFRLVNYAKFADFLIAVEAEMYKVSWPTWTELVRSSMVVIVVILGMAAVLALFDVVWVSIFKYVFGIQR